MYKNISHFFAVFCLIVLPQVVISQTHSVGETVILQGGTAHGIPLHRQPRSSRFAHADPGSAAEIVDTYDNGRWLFLKLETARAWVLAQNTTAVATVQPPDSNEVERSKLLDVVCAGAQRQTLKNDLFVICQDRHWRIPLWVAYVMRGDELDGPGDRHRSSWQIDSRVIAAGQANSTVYLGSGFHKGHLAPAQAYVRTQSAVNGTHIYTNAVPQFGSINSGAWAKLEAAVRHMAMAGADLWIITGSLFVPIDPRCQVNRPPERCLVVDTSQRPTDPVNRMRSEIAVPSHTFKAVLAEQDGVWSSRAFIMPNIPRGAGKFRNYRFSVDQLERMLGLDLFQSLPDQIEQRIEVRATPLTD